MQPFPQAFDQQGRAGTAFFAAYVQGDQKQVQPAGGHQEGGPCDRSDSPKSGRQDPQPTGVSIEQYAKEALGDRRAMGILIANNGQDYLDKATQMWMSHVEEFEKGEAQFAERRGDALRNLQTTREALHDAHQRTMGQDVLASNDIDSAQEALDATMTVGRETTPQGCRQALPKSRRTSMVWCSRFAALSRRRSGKRDRSRSRGHHGDGDGDHPDVEVVEPADKKVRDST